MKTKKILLICLLGLFVAIQSQSQTFIVDGILLHTVQKAEGEAFFPIAKQPAKVLIVQGQSGRSQKVLVR